MQEYPDYDGNHSDFTIPETFNEDCERPFDNYVFKYIAFQQNNNGYYDVYCMLAYDIQYVESSCQAIHNFKYGFFPVVFGYRYF